MSSKPTICLWKWKSDGWRKPYTEVHVNNMVNMLKKHVTVPYNVVCITDEPTGIECDTYKLWDQPIIKVGAGRPNCYKRLFMFSKEAKEIFGDRIISIDIDAIICKNIDDVISDPAPFKAINGTCAPYNGSLWSLQTGTHTDVWTDFSSNAPNEVFKNTRRANGRPYYGSDQAWMSYKIKGAPTWGDNDGIYQYHSGRDWTKLPDNLRIMFSAGNMKFWDQGMKTRSPNLYTLYKENSK